MPICPICKIEYIDKGKAPRGIGINYHEDNILFYREHCLTDRHYRALKVMKIERELEEMKILPHNYGSHIN